jgi:hypothetical protein
MMESNNITFEKQVLELTNQERVKNGLSPLKANNELNYAADKYAQDMSEGGFFSHTGPDGSKPWDRAEAVGYEARMMGENIAAGQRTPQQVVKDWMNSPGHRQNILRPQYKELGVGFHNNYWVQNFGSGDTNPISLVPNTSNTKVASESSPTPASPSKPTTTLDSFSSSSPVAQTLPSVSDTDKPTNRETINNQGDDWLLKGGMSNNPISDDTFSGASGRDTSLIAGQVDNFNWMNNLQLSQNKPVTDYISSIEMLPTPQLDNHTTMADRNTKTLFPQIKEINGNVLVAAEPQNTFV